MNHNLVSVFSICSYCSEYCIHTVDYQCNADRYWKAGDYRVLYHNHYR